ncbi:hypothetical protein M409DRAFT_30120 [Zasmidium cellare ATCC 36951]|uniref:RING-type E3 ubiquitin transferase n=1 Tax=Zasmidium cellare ATCC 36951 TaxID=1080233 RepID=A0A6A6BZP9_ZASCE|nr:uncharacterized protein M409DRAFT_30120 [Zasmidium cellare ATCC 36951]KAF2159370.1 hypothetical protein M409DRAFT_30120 [Zasmidium cellare ATCC 36951]
MDDPSHFDADLSSDEPDIMNDPAFAPPQRRDTASSGFGGDTCRICRSEGTPDEPLFYPCKCSGSIKFVHQECLMEWLSHSQKKHCELCKTPFRFTKLYDANMPKTLPWTVFVGRALLHLAVLALRACRGLLVSAVWLVILPWMIRWAWRWMFWLADAGWAREAFIRKMQADHVSTQVAGQSAAQNTSSTAGSLYSSLEQLLASQLGTDNSPAGKTVNLITGAISAAFKNSTATTPTAGDPAAFWPQADASILSSWTYISELTSNPQLNRIILDIFEGQLITCVVITGFILVFLIREWVVQQQPLVNLDNLNNIQRERDQRQREVERLQRQAELLDQARARLVALQNEAEAHPNSGEGNENNKAGNFQGWHVLNILIDTATVHLRKHLASRNDSEYDIFVRAASEVIGQVRAAGNSGIDAGELADKVYDKLYSLSQDEREAWEGVLMSELWINGQDKQPQSDSAQGEEELISPSESSNSRRPPMPTRDTHSRATQIQRILEEADSAFASHDHRPAGSLSPRSTAAEPPTESASIVSAPSTEGSWLEVSPPKEPGEVIDHMDIFQENNDEMPITNAGPDAKINIKRSGKGKARAVVPEPKIESKLLTENELRRRLESRGGTPMNEIKRLEDSPENNTAETGGEQNAQSGNPFHSDGPEPDPQQAEPLTTSSVREENGTHEQAQQGEPTEPSNPTPAQDAADDDEPTEPDQEQVPAAEPSLFSRIVDWFWGDIQPQGAQEPVSDPNEEVIGEGDEDQQAPFVPIHNGQPAIADVAHEDEAAEENDPEVVAAAQQAGLDAEAVEDAEDLEGIFELVGLQGPLIGLFQTSCFCSVLVTGTVFGAVGLPYVWGKLVLSFIGAPMTFLVKTPLQVASFVADVLIDAVLLSAGWLAVIASLACDFLLSAVEVWMPKLAEYNFTHWINEIATSTAATAGYRLQKLFISGEAASADGLGWHWAFLGASVHAHASLKNLQGEVSGILNYTGCIITSVVDTISSGSKDLMWQRSLNAVSQFPEIPAKVLAGVEALENYTRPFLDMFRSLKTGALTFNSTSMPMDPALVYWNTNDRGLAVLAGYVALAAIAAVYVALDTPITRSQSGQKTEKIIRDTLRQAGGVLKVILIISIEMLAFPLYCGLLLDLAFLPLFQSASVATRWAFAIKAPYTFCFVHWFVGTCYMFHFALFVGMCRKILRKGVLWFIRDPDDPTFHPVRDVLERNVTTQLRKIAFSALVYGALVILCLGGVIWSIGKVFKGIFPIYWTPTEPIIEFPMCLLLFNFLIPRLAQLSNPSSAVHIMYAWWLRRCARVLRLSHFLFDDRRNDEEGRHVHKSWISFLLLKKGNPDEAIVPSDRRLSDGSELPDVYFRRDGKYVLTPCNDQYRPPKPGEAFLHADDEDVYIADKEGKRNDHFSKVYVPPFFRLRVTLFMVCLWMFSAFSGLCATLVPLVFGRFIFSSLLPAGVRVNDIYAYSLGAFIIVGALFAAIKSRRLGGDYLPEKIRSIDVNAVASSVKKAALQAAKCLYVYGFFYIIMPLAFALVLQFYIILPLRTYLNSSGSPHTESTANTNSTTINNTVQNTTHLTVQYSQLTANDHPQPRFPYLVDHSIHLLQDYALGLLYFRIAIRGYTTSPTSRAAEAFRRVTAENGYLNPNIRLATRYFILPATLLAFFVLLTPPLLARLSITLITHLTTLQLDEVLQTIIYRYSYPLAEVCVVTMTGLVQIAKATGRWRARIRDEVYLVGERLHNFGERKPPVGSRSVVRRER